jgi:hypothetical protein
VSNSSISQATEGYYSGGSAVGVGTPVVTVVSPAADTPVGGSGFSTDYRTARDTPIVIDITDATAEITLIIVTALFLDGSQEVVYNGIFASGYLTYSTQNNVTDGKRLSIRRTDSWPGAVTSVANLAVGLRVDVADNASGVVTSTNYWQMPIETEVTAANVVATVNARDITGEMKSRLIWQLRGGK